MNTRNEELLGRDMGLIEEDIKQSHQLGHQLTGGDVKK